MGSGNFFEKARTPSFFVMKFMNVTEIAKLNKLIKKKRTHGFGSTCDFRIEKGKITI